MSFEPRDYLRHIAVEADYLTTAASGLSYESFISNETLQRAFVRSLEIIGERQRRFQTTSVRSTPRSSGGRWPACATD
jgi:uncharacterized protein with HEPN domain